MSKYDPMRPLCLACYDELQAGRMLVLPAEEWPGKSACCFCGAVTHDGIFYAIDREAQAPNLFSELEEVA